MELACGEIDHQPFDWSLTRWLGVSDLVYAMVLYWDTPTRRTLEMPMLERYHAAITAGGVSDYTFAQLIHDYRFCIVEAIAAAVEWCVLPEDRQRMQWLWMMQLLSKSQAKKSITQCLHCWG